MKGIIYKWTCNVNGKSYIGQTTNEKRREKDFFSKFEPYTNENSKIDKARKKYGLSEGTWSKEVLKRLWCKEGKESELLERLNYWEKYYIKEYDTFNNGYNSTDGGGHDFIFTDEIRNKLKEIGKSWWENLSKEEQERIKKLGSKVGKERWENMSPEEKEYQRKISAEANIGKYNGHSIERQMLSSSLKMGVSRSEETKKKIKETLLAKKDKCITYGNKPTYPGCYWIDRIKRWRSSIKYLGKKYLLGHFVSPEAASEIYQEALKERGNNNFENWYSDIINHKLRYYEKYNEKTCK